MPLHKICSRMSTFVFHWGTKTGGYCERLHQSWAEWKHHLPEPADHSLPKAAHNTVGLLCCENALLIHGQLVALQNPKSGGQSCFPTGWTAMYWCMEVFHHHHPLSSYRTLCFSLLNFSSFFSARFCSLQSPSEWQQNTQFISHAGKFHIICEPAEDAHHPILQVINESVEQHRAWLFSHFLIHYTVHLASLACLF